MTFNLRSLVLLSAVLAIGASQAHALGNGLAQTPPMGWNSWNNFGCNVSDVLIQQTADALVSSGLAAAGYKFVNIDDCWQNVGRTNGHVTATSSFPNGIKAVADYVHSKGLKLGIYSDHGTLTCAGRAGSYGFETTDANDYASWGVDYLKYDNCNLPAGDNMQQDYERMRDALATSGRPIVYSICAWAFQSWMPATGNLWRTTGDINNSWDSIWGIPDGNNASASVAGPGAWNDPDMLEVGRGLTDTEDRTHFGWWAIMAAPLIAGNDVRSMSSATAAILEAPEIIAVDQDPAGRQGTRVWDGGNGQNIWSKVLQGTNRRAVFVLNGSTAATNITVSWTQIGLPAGTATVRDLWARSNLGTFTSSIAVNAVPAHGSRMLLIESTGSGPAGYTFCAMENGTCAFDGAARVAYGANGAFNYGTYTTSVGCNNAAFGDPASGTTKACYYQTTGPVPITSGGTYAVTNWNSLKCVDASGAATANGTSVQQYACNGSTAQQWVFTATDSGYFQIATKNATGQVWDVQGGTTATADGIKVALWGYGSGTNQQWKPTANGAYYTFVARHSGKCLDVNAATMDNVQLQQWACNNGGAQLFSLKLLSTGPTPTATPTPTRTPTATATSRATPTRTSTPTATATGATTTSVNLTSTYNVNAAYTNGTTFPSNGGIDGVGSAYSSTLLGTSMTWSSATFNFGPANQPNGARNRTITLPAGQFSALLVLGTGVNGDQTAQTVRVNYNDGTSSTFTQTFSNWLFASQNVAGQSVARTMAYRNRSTGVADNRQFNLYGYSFTLDKTRVVSSLVLPANNNVTILAATLRN